MGAFSSAVRRIAVGGATRSKPAILVKNQEITMQHHTLSRLALAGVAAAAVFGGGCLAENEGGVIIQTVTGTKGAPECAADQTKPIAQALFDIGTNASNANDLILPLLVATNLPSTFTTQNLGEDHTRSPNYSQYGNTDENLVTFTESEVFFSTDEDRADQLQLGQVEGTPVNENSVRITTVAGTVFNQQTQLLTSTSVFATGITRADATLLQTEPFVANAIQAGGTARIIVNLRLVGETTGNTKVETPPFPFPVALCAGCLINPPDCGVDAAGNPVAPRDTSDQVCFNGNNDPNFSCN